MITRGQYLEAEKRFPEGTKFIPVTSVPEDNELPYVSEGKIQSWYSGIRCGEGTGLIYLDGKWAEVVGDSDLDKLLEVSKPLIKYLNDNYHPHVQATVTPTGVTLMEGIMSNQRFFEFVKD